MFGFFTATVLFIKLMEKMRLLVKIEKKLPNTFFSYIPTENTLGLHLDL